MEQGGSGTTLHAVEPATVWGMIDAEDVVFPVRSDELNALAIGFLAPSERVRPLLAGEAFEPVVGADGTTEVWLALHEYASGDWGPVTSVDLCVAARPAGAPGDDGLFVLPAPIDGNFGNEATYWAMGIPHRLGVIEVTYAHGGVEFAVGEGGRPALAVRARLPAQPPPWVSLRRRLYSYVDGRPHVVPLDLGFPTEALDPADVHVELGEGPLADTLRAIGIPDRLGLCTWGERLSAVFHLPEPLGAEADGPVSGATGCAPAGTGSAP